MAAVCDPLSDTLLSGPSASSHGLSLEEIIRPFGVTGHGISFLAKDGRLELSYAALAERTAAAAAWLLRAGVTAGSPVSMTVRNDLPSVLAVLGTWAVGATVVSLPPAPRGRQDWHARRFRPVLQAMSCGFLVGDEVTDAELSVSLGTRLLAKRALARAGLDGDGPGHAQAREEAVPGTALIQFTSGSMGTPKGVAISGRALSGHVAAIITAGYYNGDTDRIASWLPLYHDMGLIAMFLTGLAGRMDQVIAEPSSFATRPDSWLTMLAREKATVTAAPNFAYRLAAAVPYDSLDLSRLRICISGGERLDWQALQDFHATAAPMGLGWSALTPCYGLAEGVVGVTHTPAGRGPLRGPGGYVSSGSPLPGVEVRVPAGSAPRPIHVRGPWLFSGYHTADGFEPVSGDWFDTGDAGFVHDGELYVLGRRSEVLSMAGRNVFAEDVESVTHEACGSMIQACAAFRNPVVADRFGLLAEANPRMVRDSDAGLELARRIQAAVNEILGTRLTPVLVARLGAIPRTTSGKVQRHRCRSFYYNGEAARRLIAELA
jgi:fatty-acyl-CoA synthase